jgi:hypothetical protein
MDIARKIFTSQSVYADTDVCRWNLTQLNYLALLNLQFVDEPIADAPAVFHWPCPYDKSFEDKISEALSICSKVIILVSELHQDSADFITKYQHEKLEYFVCGFVKGHSHFNWMSWFITTCYFYKSTNLLNELNPYVIKPKTFDILLGWKKPHRSVVYDYIKDHNFSDRVIMTYFTDRSKTIDQQGIWDKDIVIPPDTFNSITQVSHSGQYPTLSQLISVDIYNSSAYTVVCETNYNNNYSFFTEKIVKPILGERLFIVFSGQHYLRNLRKLGFKTFDGIIDETYDSTENNAYRFTLACEQIRYLLDQPQDVILSKVRTITEYNKNLMLETDWQRDFFREFQSVLLDHARQN